jgi:ribosomal protein S24E
MQITITSQKENKFLNRKEVSADMTFEKTTPSNADVKGKLAEMLNVQKDNVIVKQIKPVYGKKTAYIKSNVYETLDALQKAEPKIKEKTKKEEKK